MSLGIFFDNPTGIYRADESVSGNVTAALTEPLTVKGIRLTIQGRAECYWSIGSTHYRGRQDFVLNTITVWGNPSMASSLPTPILPSGRHTFNFSFPLPDWSPGTFLFKNFGNYGKIEYSIRAHIERPAFKFDIRAERPFIVYPVYNLNLNPQAALPQETQGGKNICCWCCAAGRIGVIASLPKSGYANGEVIAATADIINHSRKTVYRVTMSLIQHVRFQTESGISHFDHRCIELCSRHEPIKPGQTQHWANEGIRVPGEAAIVYPTFVSPLCKTLSIHYIVLFEIFFNGCEPRLEVGMPVIIGTVPVSRDFFV